VKREIEQEQIKQIVYRGLGLLTAIAAIVLPYTIFVSDGGVQYLSTNDLVQLKETFYGGQPWVVFCQKSGETLKETVTGSIEDMQKAGISVGIVNCTSQLPSGKTIAEKFKLSKTKPVTGFLCVNGKKPVQLPKEAVKSSAALLKWAKPQSAVSIASIQHSADLRKRCLSEKVCALAVKNGVLSKQELIMFNKVANAQRNVKFAVLDTSEQEFSLAKSFPKGDGPFLVQFKKTGANKTLAAKVHKGNFDKSSLTYAIKATLDTDYGDAEFTTLKTKPTLKKNRITKPKVKKPVKEKKEKKHKKPKVRVKDTKDKAQAEDVKEGMSEEEMQRRKALDEEMASMFQEVDEEEVIELDAEDDEDEDDTHEEEVEIEAEEEEEEM